MDDTAPESDRFARVREVFRDTRQIEDAGARLERLDTLAGDDPVLRREVEALLADHLACGGDEARAPDSLFRKAVDSVWDAATGGGAALPRRIGDYEILGILGRGGMATVYRARQRDPARDVALKVLQLGATHETAEARFRQEAEVLGRLSHDGIAQVHAFGRAETPDGLRDYIAMELVDGADLIAFAADVGLEVRARVELLVQVLDAIAHAHHKGIIHRDLKPSNVFVSSGGRVKLLNFGAARMLDAETVHTRTGDILGTLRYMAPEQLGRGGAEPDTRTDVFAVGVLAYELLGQLPFRARSDDVSGALEAILRDEPPTLERTAPSVPRDLSSVVRQAVDRDPERRYATAEAFADDLRRFLDSEPVLARDPTWTYRAGMFVRRNTALVSSTLAVILALVLGLGLALRYANEAAGERRTADYVAAVQRLGAASADLQLGRVGAARRRLDEVPPAYRSWAWHVLHASLDQSVDAVDLPSLGPLTERPPTLPAYVVDLDADGRLTLTKRRTQIPAWPTSIYYKSAAPAPVAIDFATGGRAWLIRQHDKLLDWSWQATPALNVLVDGDALHLRVARRILQSRPGTYPSAAALHPTRPLVLIGSADHRTSIWDRHSNRMIVAGLPHDGRVVGATWSADGQRFATSSATGSIRVYDTETTGLLRVLRGEDPAVGLAFSPDSRFLISREHDGLRSWFAEAELLAVRGTHEGTAGYVYGVAVSPDGRRVASASWDGTVRITHRVDGALLRTLRADPDDSLFDVTWLADARIVAKGRHSTYVFDGETGARVGSIRKVGSGRDLVPHPDGHAVIWANPHDASVVMLPVSNLGAMEVVLPASERDETRKLNRRFPMATPIAWSKDGKVIVQRSLDGGWFARALAGGSVVATGPARADSEACLALQVHPRSGVLYAGSGRHVIAYDLASGDRLRVLEGHAGPVHALALHPDGRLLVSGGDAGVIRVWDLETGAELIALHGHRRYVRDLAFTPDGKTLVSGSGDGTVRLWSSTPLSDRRRAAASEHTRRERLRPEVAALFRELDGAEAVLQRVRDPSFTSEALDRATAEDLVLQLATHR